MRTSAPALLAVSLLAVAAIIVVLVVWFNKSEEKPKVEERNSKTNSTQGSTTNNTAIIELDHLTPELVEKFEAKSETRLGEEFPNLDAKAVKANIGNLKTLSKPSGSKVSKEKALKALEDSPIISKESIPKVKAAIEKMKTDKILDLNQQLRVNVVLANGDHGHNGCSSMINSRDHRELSEAKLLSTYFIIIALRDEAKENYFMIEDVKVDLQPMRKSKVRCLKAIVPCKDVIEETIFRNEQPISVVECSRAEADLFPIPEDDGTNTYIPFVLIFSPQFN